MVKTNSLADVQEAIKKKASYHIQLDPDKVDPACRQYAETINSLLKVAEDLRIRTQLVFADNPLPILIFDKNWNILTANQAYSDLSGIDRSQLRKMNAKSFKILDQKGEGLKAAFTNKKRSYGEVTVEMPAGTKILEQYGIPILDDSGDVQSLFVIYNNITERRTLEERLKRSISEIGEILSNLSSGDLTRKAVIFKDDPLEKVKRDLNKSVDNLTALISEVMEMIGDLDHAMTDILSGTDEIARASQTVATTAQKTSDDAKSQLQQLEQVSREIAELSGSVERIAKSSHSMAETSRQVLSAEESARKLGKDATGKMNIVQDLSRRAMDEMVTLDGKTQEISNIVKVITDIANQTNLLALNAAIEAARAGEHGRGFAVVAGEVRNLAGGSKNATKNIDNVIRDISNSSGHTVNSMKKAYEEIITGIRSVEITIEALNQMAAGVRATADSIAEISKATENQAVATGNVMSNVDLIHDLIVKNERNTEHLAALAEESSASIEEIASATNEIKIKMGHCRDIMGSFRLKS
ncbi:MAG: Sensory rhodopsin II transducer [Methanoregulaceae archaeon PtaB.Bin056]|nr:MAG: Sensory rhodopsin II transducer [Methanoregulaceae archaeon PtaB.Bin056]